MSQSFPSSLPSYPDTTGGETLGAAGNGIGLSRILDDYGLDITAMGTKIGTGSSTPTTGKVLRANGTGTSVWGAVDLTVDITGTLAVSNGGTGATTHTSGQYLKGAGTGAFTSQSLASLSQAVGDLLMPIGFIYTTVTSTNPSTAIGFGTWTAFGAGKVLVGLDSGDTDFDTVEETGGAKTVAGASHTHDLSSNGYAYITLGTTTGEEIVMMRQTVPTWTHTHDIDTAAAGTGSSTRSTGATLGGTTNSGTPSATSVVQPYIVVYMWKRTA